jgi:hypothetical protein
MSMLEEKAAKIATVLAADKTVPRETFDPLIILTLAGFVVQIINALMNSCKVTPAAAAARANQPKFLDRWRVRSIAREHLGKHHLLGPYTGQVATALLTTAKGTTETEMLTLYAEAKGAQHSVI